ncbi:MAG: Hsp70 family protein [Cyanobacteria bacterium P01_H01_bin.15]
MTTLALDFGTSNTVLAVWNATTESGDLVALPELSQLVANDSPPLIPSLVYVENASEPKLLMGQSVRDRGFDTAQDSRFFCNFKRGIGAEIQGFLPELDRQPLNFERLGQWFLNGILNSWQAAGNSRPDNLILTVPVDSFEPYRNWLTEACAGWCVERVQLVDEPTAAALGYGQAGGSILVVDFGGGTVDFALVKLEAALNNPGFLLKLGSNVLGKTSAQKPKLARVLGKAGGNLGGSDIDNWLLDYFCDHNGLPRTPFTLRLCERLKIGLSQATQAEEVFFNEETLETLELSLTRLEFEQILRERGFFEQLNAYLQQTCQQGERNGTTKTDIDAVLLVGGTTQIPAVRNWLSQEFSPNKIKAEKPFSAIATGALSLSRGLTVKDFLYHSYGIRYWSQREQRHQWHPIIREGQPYPTEEPVELVLGASQSGQPSLELILGELGSQSNQTEVYFDGSRLVTRTLTQAAPAVQTLNDTEQGRTLAPLNPPGFPGQDRLKLLFSVDDERRLRVTIEDLLTDEMLLENKVIADLR